MHILIVSHYYPPLNVIASLRPAALAKYFVEEGIDVTVLTTKKNKGEGSLDLDVFGHPRLKVVEVPYSQLKFWSKPQSNIMVKAIKEETTKVNKSNRQSTLTGLRKFIVSYLGSLVDYQFFWSSKAISEFKTIHKKKPVDVVISTFSPAASHFIANAIKKDNPSIKWIADYRDLWSNNHLMAAKGIFHYIERFIEEKTIANANHLTTVSEPLLEDLVKLTKNKIPASVIYNGYDTELDEKVFAKRKVINGAIRIVYTGTIYKGRRDPSPLLLALNELEEEGIIKEGDVRIEFYGLNNANIIAIAKLCKAEKWVDIKGFISYKKSIEVQNEADFLLFLESNEPDARGVLTGKLFEYMITGKTILALGVDEFCASSQVINETQIGIAFGKDKNRIKDYLRDVWISKAIPNQLANYNAIAKYSRVEQSKRMLHIAMALEKRSIDV